MAGSCCGGGSTLTNEEIWELESWLRRRLGFWITYYAFEAYNRGLPHHLVVHAVESTVSSVLSRLREHDVRRRELEVISRARDSGGRNPGVKGGGVG